MWRKTVAVGGAPGTQLHCSVHTRYVAVRASSASQQAAVPTSKVSLEDIAGQNLTLVSVSSKDSGNLLMQLARVFSVLDLRVVSASIRSDEGGGIFDEFKVQTHEGRAVPVELRAKLVDELERVLSTSMQSTMPEIYGIAAEAEVARLKSSESRGAAAQLELAAAELSSSAADLVRLERALDLIPEGSPETERMSVERARMEAAATLERKMASMEAALAARRAPVATPTLEQEAAEAEAAVEERPVQPSKVAGPAAGSGKEIILQGFNWESCKQDWYSILSEQAAEIAADYTAVWMPPPSDSVSPQGYLPRDLFQLDSAYGGEADLRSCIQTLKKHGLKAVADIVINHRCAHFQDEAGRWNRYGGRLDWDSTAICCNNREYGGRGSHKTGEDYTAAPNIDHTNEGVQDDLVAWLLHLKNVGFDGWRFDFVKGYHGRYAKLYVDGTAPELAFGEFWDTCAYRDAVLEYDQDAHRQRTVDWIDQTGGSCAAFDFTTKGILQEACARSEYWRLQDRNGRPAGLVGMWPSRAITFIENHDTGSTLNHWPFPWNHLHQGYAYILTHPGTPCVFYDHHWQQHGDLGPAIRAMIDVRKRCNLSSRSKVVIRRASDNCYAAVIDDRVAMKIGHGPYSPNKDQFQSSVHRWQLAVSGPNFAVWTDEKFAKP